MCNAEKALTEKGKPRKKKKKKKKKLNGGLKMIIKNLTGIYK